MMHKIFVGFVLVATGLNLLLSLAFLPHTAAAQQDTGPEIESRGLPGQLAPGKGASFTPPLPGAAPIAPGTLSLGANCIPVEVTTSREGVQIKCKIPLQAPAGLQFFAVGTDDPPFASRIMKLAATAQIANAQIRIVFNPGDLSGERIGCTASNCRLIQAVTLIDN